MSVTTNIIETVNEVISTTENDSNGDEFAGYVRHMIFPPDRYDLLEGTQNNISNLTAFFESIKDPDLKFRAIRDGSEFFVEATFCPDYGSGPLQCCKCYQLERFRRINFRTPVFMVAGIGEDPGAPRKVFLIPIGKMMYSKIYWNILSEFEIDPRQNVNERLLDGLNY